MGRTPAGKTRKKVYEFMRQRLLAREPPTVREVQEAFGFRSVRTAQQHLERLLKDGDLVIERGRARGYRLPEHSPGRPSFLVPLLGRVPAGSLDLAVQDLEGYLVFQGRGRGEDHFALRVRGESMRDAGILPGDLLVVRRQASAENGDIVVALIGEEATVKRLRIGKKKLELRPANPDFEPIRPDPKELTILGKVVEVRRKLEEAQGP